MEKSNFFDAYFEDISILNRGGLVTIEIIDRETVPEGLYAYDLRKDSEGYICELRDYIPDEEHWGTVIVANPFEDADKGIPVTDDDYSIPFVPVTVEEYMKYHGVPLQEQQMC